MEGGGREHYPDDFARGLAADGRPASLEDLEEGSDRVVHLEVEVVRTGKEVVYWTAETEDIRLSKCNE